MEYLPETHSEALAMVEHLLEDPESEVLSTRQLLTILKIALTPQNELGVLSL